jgi:translation initiation factor 2 gamma subunit (eIF-2gamma)
MAAQVIHAIIGTAGHIDHGKTALIKALTGQDTDRLQEEKAMSASSAICWLAPTASISCSSRLPPTTA